MQVSEGGERERTLRERLRRKRAMEGPTRQRAMQASSSKPSAGQKVWWWCVSVRAAVSPMRCSPNRNAQKQQQQATSGASQRPARSLRVLAHNEESYRRRRRRWAGG